MLELDAIIDKANDLEPLPASVTRLASLVVDDTAGIDDIAEVVSFDQGLTAKLLRYANSASSGVREPLTTVNAAVIRLGLGQVLQVATAASVRKRIDVPIPEYGLREGYFWRHSVAAALAAECMGPVLKRRLPPESFTAALLHDVGKLVLSRFLEPELLEYLERARREGGCNPLEAECEILGVHHAELGGLVCQGWRLPDAIVQGVMHHHTPTDGFHLSCHVTHVANLVVRQIERSRDAEAPDSWTMVHPESARLLGFDEERFAALCARVDERLDEVLERFGAIG